MKPREPTAMANAANNILANNIKHRQIPTFLKISQQMLYALDGIVKTAIYQHWDRQGTSYPLGKDKVYDNRTVSNAKETMERRGLTPANCR